MTPIDWKPSECDMALGLGLVGHHSMVTPIDWKPLVGLSTEELGGVSPLAGDTY